MERQSYGVLAATESIYNLGQGASPDRHGTESAAETGGIQDLHRRIVVAATFTADPITKPLEFWMHRLEIQSRIEIAPYGQLFQSLLNPSSCLRTNITGCNVLLIRVGDWARDRAGGQDVTNHIRSVSEEFIGAVEIYGEQVKTPTIVVFCPTTPSESKDEAGEIEAVQSRVSAQLAGMPSFTCITHDRLQVMYPVEYLFDHTSDRIGHIPYTHDYFVAAATMVARSVAAFLKTRWKVIVVDADNTLWDGICGELGANGIVVTPAHAEFQKSLLQQRDLGMLLCLCSKNNLSDIDAVFDANEMPIKKDHFISMRVNWSPKSSNLVSMADELDLALDSFVFIDDSPIECAEVETTCPQVLTLRFPPSPELIRNFIDHVWAFDSVGATEDAKNRSYQYETNKRRKREFDKIGNIDQFMSSLDLQVEVSRMQESQLPRVCELVLRTNQFNCSNKRRRIGEIEFAWKSQLFEIFTVIARDRFGDYGLVGAVFSVNRSPCLEIDTFVLSCRALGRGVEHRVVNSLAVFAREQGLSTIDIRFVGTHRNQPARDFLGANFEQFRAGTDVGFDERTGSNFRVPVEFAAEIRPAGFSMTPGAVEERRLPKTTKGKDSNKWHRVGQELDRIEAISREIARADAKGRDAVTDYVAPANGMERELVRIWSQLLHIPRIGIRDDFFDLGGDSVLAVQLIARIESEMKLDLSLAEIFDAPTVREMAMRLASGRQSAAAIVPRQRSIAAPLSWTQQRLWFIDQLEHPNAAYHVPIVIRLFGDLDESALRSSLDSLLERHEILRMVFLERNNELVQQLTGPRRIRMNVVDLRSKAVEQEAAETDDEFLQPFDLSKGPLIRARLLRISDSEHVLLVVMHHIISDGWSLSVLCHDLGVLYSAHTGRGDHQMSPLPIQYVDYVDWQQNHVRGILRDHQLKYWTEKLRGSPPILKVPADRARPATQSYRGSNLRFEIDPKATLQIREFSRRNDVTVAMTTLTAWFVLLFRLSGQDDIVIGMPVANRGRAELEGLIGYFANTLAIRIRAGARTTIASLIENVRTAMIGGLENQDIAFEQVVEALQPVRSLSHGLLFQSMFVFQNTPRRVMEFHGLNAVREHVFLPVAQFDLTMIIHESDGRLDCNLNYSRDLFDDSTVAAWGDMFTAVLRQIPQDLTLTISNIPLISEAQRRTVIHAFNTMEPFDSRKQIHELFEDQANLHPDAIAVIYLGQRVTYGELNSKANKLAHYILKNGAAAGTCIPILLSRSTDSLVAQIAILKCRCTYVPLDPEFPIERLKFIIGDCDATLLITGEDDLSLAGPKTVNVQKLEGQIASMSSRNPCIGGPRGIPAYLMYTSGSTGVPKGVLVSHEGVVRLVTNTSYVQISRHDCFAHHSNTAFDASTFEVWGALLNGARICVIPRNTVLEPKEFSDALIGSQVSILWMSVGLFNQYAARLSSCFEGLRYLIVGGDALDPEIVNRVMRTSRPQAFLNGYGPTECTTFSTTYSIENIAGPITSIPIGSPISNTQVYILDTGLHPVPIGVPGDLYVGGPGVALGYLNRPEATATRFLPDPFTTVKGARMYRTGDRGRWLKGGNIEFLGRDDEQVKLRGFRVELEEISSRILDNSGVSEAVVVVRERRKNDRQLIAYFVASSEPAPTAGGLRAHLKAVLPEYMIPSAFVCLENLPLTPNGKVDRCALPEPSADAYAGDHYEAPRGETEAKLAHVWQMLLNVDRVGRDDNFFSLGGHSLLATRIATQVRELFGVELPVRAFFESPTIARIAVRIEAARSKAPALQPALISGDAQKLSREIRAMSAEGVRARLAELEKQLAEGVDGRK